MLSKKKYYYTYDCIIMMMHVVLFVCGKFIYLIGSTLTLLHFITIIIIIYDVIHAVVLRGRF